MDLASATVVKAGNQLHVVHGDDSKLYVEFSMEAEHQGFESEQQGRPIFKDVPFITIHFAGDSTKRVVRPVKDEDKERFARQWQQFENQQEQTVSGTPLEQWAMLTKADVASLKAIKIMSVEQLAGVNDSNLATLGLGGRTLRDKAVKWLETAKDGAALSAVFAENETLKADLAAIKQQLAELGKKQKKES